MLDPTRYALNAETVGFRKRTLQTVDWGAFNQALQTQSDSIKVRRELEETPVTELHVMGGQRFGLEGNVKTNELARQQRQMNGYVLRSFLSTGGPVILPPKKNDSVLAIPSKFGHIQYTPNAVQGQQYVSSFTEPLNAPLENNTILLGRQGIQAKSNSISDPYKALQFQMGMEASQAQIKAVADAHAERKSADGQEEFARQSEILSAPKHLRPTVSLMQQIQAQKGQAPAPWKDRPGRRPRFGAAIARGASEMGEKLAATDLNDRKIRGNLKRQKAEAGQRISTDEWAREEEYKYEDMKKNKGKGSFSPIPKSGLDLSSTDYLDFEDRTAQDFLNDQSLRHQESQYLLDKSSNEFEDIGLEMAAKNIESSFDLTVQEARQIILMSSNDTMQAVEMAKGIVDDRRRNQGVYLNFSAEEIAELSTIFEGDIPNMYSATDFNSSIGNFIAKTDVAPAVPLRGSDLYLNDSGVPTGLPSAGLGIRTPAATDSSSLVATDPLEYMTESRKPPSIPYRLQPEKLSFGAKPKLRETTVDYAVQKYTLGTRMTKHGARTLKAQNKSNREFSLPEDKYRYPVI